MARIRSIKPEFWVDEKIAKLPKATALFFIALWNFADDQGIITDDPRQLSLWIPIYRSQDVHKMLNALFEAGLDLVSESPLQGDDCKFRPQVGRRQHAGRRLAEMLLQHKGGKAFDALQGLSDRGRWR